VQLDLENLPADPTLLHVLIRDMAAALDADRGALDEAKGEIDRLKAIIRELQRARFGRRSERMDADQLALGLEDLDADVARLEESLPAAADAPVEAACEARSARCLPEHLARSEIVLDVESNACPCCGEPLHRIGESVSEMLDWVPAELRVLRVHRPKYACRSCGTAHQAAAPERAIAKGMATPKLLAQVLTAKFCDHLPLYRQAQIFARHGVPMQRSTLSNWIGGACWWLEPLHEQLAENVFASTRVFADDTPVPVLDPGRGRTKTGRLWAYVRDDRACSGSDPPAAVYFYSPDRKGERTAAHLANFNGVLQVDGYAGFEQLAEGGKIVLAACWAHVRRKFYDVHETTGSPIAAEALRRIGELYAIEARIRGATPRARRVARRAEARPRIKALKAWLETELPRLPGRGKLAEAIRYALARWPALCLYLDDGRIDIDNNPVERAIRPIALGRKNHLFAGSDGGGERWAIVCSLIETAKLNGVEPFAYLADVLERMVDGYPRNRLDDLLPWNWSASGSC